MDNCRAPNNTVPGCYSDNVGSLNVTVKLQDYVPDWIEPTLSMAPSARCCAGMAYDAARNYTLLFGGGASGQLNSDPHNDTWIWRSGWRELLPVTSPPARNSTTLAYDKTTRTILLFGGTDANGNFLNDTWTWDGVTWTQQFPPVSPPGRALDAGMAYDAASESVILFGGVGASGFFFGDTWEWNGQAKSWTQLFPTSSPTPREAAVAYDPITSKVVLFGDSDSAGNLGDTWVWDGITWLQQNPAPALLRGEAPR